MKVLDFSTLFGLLMGLGLIVWAILIGGNPMVFWDFDSVLIVLGGVITGCVVHFSLRDLIDMIKHTGKAFRAHKYDPLEMIDTIVSFAEKARREGLLSLEDDTHHLENDFLKKGIQLVVDGTDPALVRDIMETRLVFEEEGSKFYQDMYKFLANIAPAYGMLGTLIGLIQMLKTLDDPGKIAAGMGTAIITTLYGSFLANFLFIPLAGKLKVITDKEVLMKELMIEGLLSIQAGENPRIVEEKLKAFLSPARRRMLNDRLETAVGSDA